MTIKELHSIFLKSEGINTDTRTLKKNELFFALNGANFIGNTFSEKALKAGALFSVIDDKAYQTKNTILVKNTLHTLQQLANYHRKTLDTPLLAITGSNGKTTTKELISAVLQTTFNTISTQGNLNNHIGVPLTLLRLTKQTELGVIEMGANHPGEINFLCEIAEPNYGYITNFGKAHLEGFKSLEGVVKAKTELYRYIDKTAGLLFVNEHPDQLKESQNMKRVQFGTAKNTDIHITTENFKAGVNANYSGLNIQSNLIGAYNATNISAAIAIGDYFKVETNNIKNAIETYYPTNNRSQIIIKGNLQIILDAYNANPTSMEAAIENLSTYNQPTTAILGDMFELGLEAQNEHQRIASFAERKNFTNTVFIGSNFNGIKNKPKNATFYETLNSFKAELNSNTLKGTVLIKGSRGMALEQILGWL